MDPIKNTTGANIDFRPEEDKNKDWRPEEAFAGTSPIVWREKTIEEVEAEIRATSISQGHTYRCVSEYAGIFFENAEYLETGKRIVFSRRDIYFRRTNKPLPGMSMHDLFSLMRKGACLESQLPSTATKETEINLPYVVTEEMITARNTYASEASFTWADATIDDIARTIESKTPVCLFWYFEDKNPGEWWMKQPKVKNENLNLYADSTSRHQAAGVSYLLVDGVKHIAVLDSSGQGSGMGKKKNIRYISENFFNDRCYGAGFAIDKKNLDYKPEPTFKYTFTRNLRNGDNGEDVRALQKILVLEGCLVLKDPTIYFRGMTEAGVKKLQEKYAAQILAPLGLKNGTGLFLESTRKFINKKYS